MSAKEKVIFWEGFDSAVDMAINLLDTYDSNELAPLSVFDFVEKFKDDLLNECELYKKDN